MALLLLALFLIARDLFRKSPSALPASCCNDEYAELKQIDTALLAYTKIKVIETGLINLSGITVSETNEIFVCGNGIVAAFDTDGIGTGRFEIDSAAGTITVDNSNIYLGIGPRIFSYTVDGAKVSEWKAFNPDGYITSLAVNENYVYAADAISKTILKYNSAGDLLQEIGIKDSLSGARGFIIPSMYFDISFGSFNDLWVVNPGRLSIENFTVTGLMQSEWGIPSFENEGFGGCCNPAHFDILPDGDFVTYEKGVDKIKIFDPTGSFVGYVAAAGSFKGNTDLQLGNLDLVKDIAAGPDGNIYVLDAYNQISIFSKTDL